MAVWLFLWEAAVRIAGSSYTATPPLKVLAEFFSGLQSDFWFPLFYSLKRIIIGYTLALIIGISIGILIATSSFFRWLFGLIILGVQSLPSICWLPVAILWFGLNEKAILFVVLMGSLGSITIAVRDGFNNIPVIYHRVGATFGAKWWQHIIYVSMPAALPNFVTGLKQGWSFAWRSLMAGELLYHSRSLGSLLSDARDLADYPRMYAVMLLIILVSILVERLIFLQLERKIHARWGLKKNS